MYVACLVIFVVICSISWIMHCSVIQNIIKIHLLCLSWWNTNEILWIWRKEHRDFESLSWQGALDSTLCDKACQWLATGWWFSPVSSTNKTDRHNITEVLLKVALHTTNHQLSADWRNVKLWWLNSFIWLELNSENLYRVLGWIDLAFLTVLLSVW